MSCLEVFGEIENKRLQRLKMKIDHLTFDTKWVNGSENIEAEIDVRKQKQLMN